MSPSGQFPTSTGEDENGNGKRRRPSSQDVHDHSSSNVQRARTSAGDCEAAATTTGRRSVLQQAAGASEQEALQAASGSMQSDVSSALQTLMSQFGSMQGNQDMQQQQNKQEATATAQSTKSQEAPSSLQQPNEQLMALLTQLQGSQSMQQMPQQQQIQGRGNGTGTDPNQMVAEMARQQGQYQAQVSAQPSASTPENPLLNQLMAAQQLLGNTSINSAASASSQKGTGADMSRTASLAPPVSTTSPSPGQQPSPIISALAQILQQFHERQRQTLKKQQEQEMQMLHQIQNFTDPQQQMHFLMQLLTLCQQNEESQNNAQPMAVQQDFHQAQPAPPSSVGSNIDSHPQQVNTSLQQMMNNPQASAGSQNLRVPHPQNFNDTASIVSQENLQLPLLQILAAQQASGKANSSAGSHNTGQQPQTLGMNSAISSNTAALLQLVSPSWNQTHNGAFFAPAQTGRVQNATTTGNQGNNYPAMIPSSIVGVSSSGHSLPSRAAAETQQRQLMQALRAASATGQGDFPSSSSVAVPFDDLKYAFPEDAFDNRAPNGRATSLPTLLVMQDDHMQLSAYQTLLRYQIEIFRASDVDATTHQRGRNKPIRVGQVGFRCRHCRHLPISERPRGSSYFPSEVEGVYQAAQNMNTTHFQHGVCTRMGEPLRRQFAALANTKATSTGAGRAYWAQQARILGLENNAEDGGIRFWRDKKSV